MVLDKALQFLKDFGFFDIILPFILIFTLVFAILEKVKILGNKKNVNITVAFIIGALGVVSTFLTSFIVDFLPKIVISLVILFIFLMFIKLLNPNVDLDVWYIHLIVPFLFIILIILQFGLGPFFSSILKNPLFWLVTIIVLIVWFLIWPSEKKAERQSKPKEHRADRADKEEYKLEKVGRVKGEELKEGFEKSFGKG